MSLLEPRVEKSGDVTIITLTGCANWKVGNQIASEVEGRTHLQTLLGICREQAALSARPPEK
jgi:hypothetical protein